MKFLKAGDLRQQLSLPIAATVVSDVVSSPRLDEINKGFPLSSLK